MLKAIVDEATCASCAACVDACPENAISMNDQDIAVVDQENCKGCEDCVSACPTEAITMQEVA